MEIKVTIITTTTIIYYYYFDDVMMINDYISRVKKCLLNHLIIAS